MEISEPIEHNDCLLIVPFFNERKRFKAEGFIELISSGDFDVLFVDDGSSDQLFETLEDLFFANKNAHLLRFTQNRGKAEAIRSGLQWAYLRNYKIVGFTDFDLSTPPHEILRLIRLSLLSKNDSTAVFGVRDTSYPSRIKTTRFRKYQGRVFQYLVNILFDLKLKDLQCGAKFFPKSKITSDIINKPFANQWLFEVEFLLRLPKRSIKIQEVCLTEWIHTLHSKVRATHLPMLVIALIRLFIRDGRIRSIISVES